MMGPSGFPDLSGVIQVIVTSLRPDPTDERVTMTSVVTIDRPQESPRSATFTDAKWEDSYSVS